MLATQMIAEFVGSLSLNVLFVYSKAANSLQSGQLRVCVELQVSLGSKP